MRTSAAIAFLMLLVCTALADDASQTPRESYEAFVNAVLDKDIDADAQQATFERYFDFDISGN